MGEDAPEITKVLYMHNFDLKVIHFCRESEYWKDGDFGERMDQVLSKGMEAIKAERGL